MPDLPEQPSYSLRFAAALAAALLLLGAASLASAGGGIGGAATSGSANSSTPAPCSIPPTQAECSEAWEDSFAQSTCSASHTQISVDGNDCSISSRCSTDTTAFPYSVTSITVCVNKVSQLMNCNGFLSVGSC